MSRFDGFDEDRGWEDRKRKTELKKEEFLRELKFVKHKIAIAGGACPTCNDGKSFKYCKRLAGQGKKGDKPAWATYQCPTCLEEYMWEDRIEETN
jgi:hypothetical protein